MNENCVFKNAITDSRANGESRLHRMGESQSRDNSIITSVTSRIFANCTPARHQYLKINRGECCLFPCVSHSNNFISRAKGLLGRDGLADDEAMVFTPCNRIHMLGMKFAIDVLFLNDEHSVLKSVENLQPNECASMKGARHTVEIAAGRISSLAIREGQQLTIQGL